MPWEGRPLRGQIPSEGRSLEMADSSQKPDPPEGGTLPPHPRRQTSLRRQTPLRGQIHLRRGDSPKKADLPQKADPPPPHTHTHKTDFPKADPLRKQTPSEDKLSTESKCISINSSDVIIRCPLMDRYNINNSNK